MQTDEFYMNLAIEEAKKAAARGEIPIGAVLVDDGKVISAAHNMRETWHDATAHAEMITIMEACALLERWRLNGPRRDDYDYGSLRLAGTLAFERRYAVRDG